MADWLKGHSKCVARLVVRDPEIRELGDSQATLPSGPYFERPSQTANFESANKINIRDTPARIASQTENRFQIWL